MKTFVIAAALLAVGSMLLFAQDRGGVFHGDGSKITSPHPLYAKGVNDALDAIALLSLEQRLEGTNRTWGAMADIVRKRLQVEKGQ